MTVVDIYADPALEVLSAAAHAVHYHFEDYVDNDDLYHEAWVWRLQHPLLVSSFLDKEQLDVNGLQRVVEGYLTSLARRERALTLGYHPDDEQFYTPRVVAELLPLTLDIESALLPSAASDGAGGAKSKNPHGQSDFVASLLDVRRAWIETAFRRDEARLIEAHFIDDMTYEHISASFGLDVEEVKKRIAIGLRRMSEYLGGLPARQCPSDCPDCNPREEGENTE